MAAGVTLRAPALAAFMEFLEDTTSGLPGDPARTGRPLLLDGLVSVAGASLELARTLARLAPFGQGNPEPVWAIEAARIVERRPLKNGHLGLTLTDAGGGRLRAVAFRCAETALGRLLLEADGPIRIAGRLKAETWQGSDRVALHLEDAAPA
jgi:single-stranded-DNA-specific exonuclease